jgi:hypothetical protein
MTRSFTYAAILVGLSASATLAINNRTQKAIVSTEARFASDGAFRDGLYLGALAAESGQQASAPVGRWSSEQDRSSFAAGYRQGFDQSKNSGSR